MVKSRVQLSTRQLRTYPTILQCFPAFDRQSCKSFIQNQRLTSGMRDCLSRKTLGPTGRKNSGISIRIQTREKHGSPCSLHVEHKNWGKTWMTPLHACPGLFHSSWSQPAHQTYLPDAAPPRRISPNHYQNPPFRIRVPEGISDEEDQLEYDRDVPISPFLCIIATFSLMEDWLQVYPPSSWLYAPPFFSWMVRFSNRDCRTHDWASGCGNPKYPPFWCSPPFSIKHTQDEWKSTPSKKDWQPPLCRFVLNDMQISPLPSLIWRLKLSWALCRKGGAHQKRGVLWVSPISL